MIHNQTKKTIHNIDGLNNALIAQRIGKQIFANAALAAAAAAAAATTAHNTHYTLQSHPMKDILFGDNSAISTSPVAISKDETELC